MDQVMFFRKTLFGLFSILMITGCALGTQSVAGIPSDETKTTSISDAPNFALDQGDWYQVFFTEPESARAELFAEDAVLFLEIVDDVTLLLVDPACERDDEELECVRKRRHVGERSRRP